MKKLLIVLFAVGLTIPAFAGRHRNISFNELPAQAREFITRHFDQSSISRIKTGSNNGHTYYNVKFVRDLKVDFDGDGQWKEIKSEDGYIPSHVLPEKIRTYIDSHHAGVQVEQIKRDRNKYEVDLINDIEIIFDSQFNFLKYD